MKLIKTTCIKRYCFTDSDKHEETFTAWINPMAILCITDDFHKGLNVMFKNGSVDIAPECVDEFMKELEEY